MVQPLLQAVWPWVSDMPSQNLSFPTCQREALTAYGQRKVPHEASGGHLGASPAPPPHSPQQPPTCPVPAYPIESREERVRVLPAPTCGGGVLLTREPNKSTARHRELPL